MNAKPLWIVVLSLACSAPLACFDEGVGVALPEDKLAFPVGLAVHSAGYALVASSNFDLMYSQGALQVIDLNGLAAELDKAVEQREDHPYYRQFFLREASIGLGNFAGTVALSDDGRLAAVTVREADELVLIDVDVRMESGRAELELSCWLDGQRPDGRHPTCAEPRYRFDFPTIDPYYDPDEPYVDPYDVLLLDGVQEAEGERGYTAFVSFLRQKRVVALDVPASDRDDVELLYRLSTFATGVFDLTLAPASGLIYATSRRPAQNTNPIHFFDPSLGVEANLNSVNLFQDLLGNETRGIAFASDGFTAGLLVRNPEILAFLDTTPDDEGTPKNTFLGSAAVGSSPSRVAAFGDRMFVTGATDDSVYVIDARTRRMVAVLEDVCRGPFEVAFWDRGDLQWALISCFESHTMAVLDADPESPTYLDVVARVGKPVE